MLSIIIYHYHTDIDNREILSSEVVCIRGTLQKSLYMTYESITTSHLNIYMNEYPETKFYLINSYFNQNDVKYKMSSYGFKDSVVVLVLRQFKNVKESHIPIYGLQINSKTYLSLGERNKIWKSNAYHNKLGLKIIVIVLLIVTLLANLGIFRRILNWYERLNALR